MRKKTTYWLAFACLFALCAFLCQCKKSTIKSGISDATPQTSPRAVTTFIHPGVINTQANLDLIASQVNSGDATRTAAYQKVLDFISNNALPTQFYTTVYVGSNGHTSPSKSQIRKDAELAYALALRFAKTADVTYANQCIAILNGWSYTFQNYAPIDASDNPNQPALEASWTTPSFVAAAEIIRYYKPNGVSANWSTTDINKFNDYLNNVKNNYINNVPTYNNNWNVSAGYAKMAIGVFLNSASVFQAGEDMINAVLPQVIQSGGTMPELCDRQDCVHYQYSLTGLTYAAEIANMQGDGSLYTALSNRISSGYDFERSAYNQSTGCNYCSTSSPIFPGVEVAYHHYGTANMLSLRNMQDPLGVPNDNTFLGFTSYTHFNVGGGTTTPPTGSNPPIGSVISLKGFNNAYVSGENGSTAMTCTRTTAGDTEHFTVIDAGGGKISLRSKAKFVSSENGTMAITCNRATAGDWEKFDWITTPDGKVTLRGNNGLFISSENGTQAMTCTRATASGWESFTVGQ
ncbi:alginate lyase family protein [Mucilaginibacter sp. NFX135]|uniref:alginate lyase family protein n=1 Tax=Mucilaginibacter sp. NFX135 TaxID=3402687 RepID=UPI003AFB2E79